MIAIAAMLSLLAGSLCAAKHGPCGPAGCRGTNIPLASLGKRGQMANLMALAQPPLGASVAGEILPLNLSILYQMVIDLEVGTPPQKVPVVLDSTLANSFLPSPNCTAPSCTYLSQHAFNSTASSTYQSGGVYTELQLGDYVVTIDSVTGVVAYDLFSLGTMQFPAGFVHVNGTLRPEVTQLMYHGRLGLGYPLNMDPSAPSVMSQIFGAGRKMYSIYFQDFTHYGVVGGLEIGGYDPSLVDASTWTTVKNYLPVRGYWAFHLQNVFVGNLPLGFNGWAAMNYASPFVTVPYAAFEVLAQIMQLDVYGTRMESSQAKATYYNVPCANASIMPSVSFLVAGKKYTFDPSQYLIGNGTDCVTLFYGHDIGVPIGTAWVFGSGVMRQRLLVFDYENDEISWASLATKK